MGKIIIRSKVQPSFPSDPVLGKKQNVYSQLNPWFVTGFVDGEGCFYVSVFLNKSNKLGWAVKPGFSIVLHKKDIAVLEKIKKILGVGKISRQCPNKLQFQVQSLKDLGSIIKFFKKYKLHTQKHTDFQFLDEIYILMLNKEHLTKDGLIKIVAIKASMNRGLSDRLKLAFPDVVPVERPRVENPTRKNIDPNWIAGFTSAEGSFLVKISKSKTKVGFAVHLEFKLTQDERDEQLMRCLIKYSNCGKIYKYRTWIDFEVTQLSDITNKIIPFYKKYPIVGVKVLDFNDFCKIAEMIKDKKHLTK